MSKVFSQLLTDDLEGRVQPFDRPAAVAAGTIAAARRRDGQTVEIRDAQLAGIAIARRANLATRNTRHFEGTGARLINPWG